LGDDVLSRIDALIPALSADPVYAAFNVSRATVLRIALMRGLESLEAGHARRFRIAQLTKPDGARVDEVLEDTEESAVLMWLRRLEAELASSPNPVLRRVADDVVNMLSSELPTREARLLAATYQGIRQMVPDAP
jgi:hypothetical protein